MSANGIDFAKFADFYRSYGHDQLLLLDHMIQGYMSETDTSNKTDYQLVSAGRDLLAQFQDTVMKQLEDDIKRELTKQDAFDRIK